MASLRPSIESLRGPPVPVGFGVPAAGGGISCQGLGIEALGIRAGGQAFASNAIRCGSATFGIRSAALS